MGEFIPDRSPRRWAAGCQAIADMKARRSAAREFPLVVERERTTRALAAKEVRP